MIPVFQLKNSQRKFASIISEEFTQNLLHFNLKKVQPTSCVTYLNGYKFCLVATEFDKINVCIT